jgi:hypothetical protein
VESFAQSSSDGNLFIANGIDPILVWDGSDSVGFPAGVLAPTTAPTLTPAGSGSITGTYYGFIRWVDGRGNYSNLSPISDPADATAAGSIDYSNLPVPTVGTVVRRQIIRNTNGSIGAVDPLTGVTTSIAYVDVDDTNVFATTATSTRLDADLSTQESVDVAAASAENGVPPAYKPFLVWHQNRMYLCGIEPYHEGSCAVTFGSKVVQGYGTRWKSTFAGRYFYTPDAAAVYVVESVDVANQTLTLTEVYASTTDPWAEYTVKPAPDEANAFQWSGPNKPEAWNPSDVLVLPEDGDRVTGAMNYGSYLYFFKSRHMYRFITRSDPATDGRVFLACNRGCVNDRSWVIVDETCYLLDTGGVYAFRGDDQGDPVSTPIQDMFNTIPGTAAKINWAAGRYFHACHSPNEEVVRWFVALAGDYVPRHAIVYAYKQQKWWIERLPFRASASVLGKIGGRVGTVAEATEQYYVGSTGGRVLAPLGVLDGAAADGSFRGQATAAGWLSLTDSNARFGPGAVNTPVAITGGKGRGQVRYVTARTATRLTLDRPWRVEPDETSTYCLGGIAFTYSSQRLRWAPGEQQMARAVELEWYPTQAPNTVRVGLAPDFSDPVVTAWDIDRGFRQFVKAEKGQKGQDVLLTNPAGYELVKADSGRESTTPGQMGRTARLVLSGVANEQPVQIGTALVTGASG